MCTVRAEKCKICVNILIEDEFSMTLPSINEEKVAINNVPTFNTKSLNKDIKKEYLRTKTHDFNRSIKSIHIVHQIKDNVINENLDEDSYNTLDESTGQEYYTYLEYTVNCKVISSTKIYTVNFRSLILTTQLRLIH